MELWRAMDAHNGGFEAQNGALDLWSVCRPIISDLHLFDKKQDPDPHQSLKSDPEDRDLNQSDKEIQILIIMFRIRNNGKDHSSFSPKLLFYFHLDAVRVIYRIVVLSLFLC